jgi:hypothetical protein
MTWLRSSDLINNYIPADKIPLVTRIHSFPLSVGCPKVEKSREVNGPWQGFAATNTMAATFLKAVTNCIKLTTDLDQFLLDSTAKP